MTVDDLSHVLSQLSYEHDARRPPDEARRRQFRTGWIDVTQRGVLYTEQTLKELTWRNLGYRLGKEFGEQPKPRIDQFFDSAATLYPGDQGSPPPPTPEQYANALEGVAVTSIHVQMLRIHYASPERTITADQLSAAFGHQHHGFANSKYGALGRLIGAALDYNPFQERVGTIVTFEWRGKWHWLMRPQIAAALEILGWTSGPEVLLPQEADALVSLPEGRRVRVYVERYERDRRLTQGCKDALKRKACCICGFCFEEVYGERAKDFIEVHHVRPLSEIGKEHVVDPLIDLAPVCPNCHAVLHMRCPAYTLDEVRQMLGSQKVLQTKDI